MRAVFVTGGVASSLGKGVLAASLGLLLQARGYRVGVLKIDPYLNIDPGTMNPCQHGEVFVLGDGAETDLDLGHYERFLHQDMTRQSSLTMGAVYAEVLAAERRGKYLGDTVQVVPHVTDAVLERLDAAARACDILLVEIGGTVGDIEGMAVYESVRQWLWRNGGVPGGGKMGCILHAVWVPYLDAAGEIKTKPAQHSVERLRQIGLAPDFLVCRSQADLGVETHAKLALHCSVAPSSVIGVPDAPSVYDVPGRLADSRLDAGVLRVLGMADGQLYLTRPAAPGADRPVALNTWCDWAAKAAALRVYAGAGTPNTLRVALVGKYGHQDAYKSVLAAVEHAACHHDRPATVTFVDAEDEAALPGRLRACDAVIVAGGFGHRGVAGKLTACRLARREGVPFLGICLGLQLAVIDFARDALGVAAADSTEFASACMPVVCKVTEQTGRPWESGGRRQSSGTTPPPTEDMGGTMRLGDWQMVLCGRAARECHEADCTRAVVGDIEPGSPFAGVVARCYLGFGLGRGGAPVSERHRHRYEVNWAYRSALEEAGLFVAAESSQATAAGHPLVEAVELDDHPFFVATQYHPELRSRPLRPHPLFCGLLEAAALRHDAAFTKAAR